MDDKLRKIAELSQKLEELNQKQIHFGKEIQSIQMEIRLLKYEIQKPIEKESSPMSESLSTSEVKPIETHSSQVELVESKPPQPISERPKSSAKPKMPSDLEKIIGESWLNKIGILILVIGVGIGAKYSIENDLISPLTRIVLGYVTGLALLGLAFKLKEKFEAYSAVLLSGAMAIFYFISFFAYSFYNLIPLGLTFALMVVFTVFTVYAALHYNRSIIAHLGLVGAYAVPFLLSSDSGNAQVLFAYLALINLGVLAVAVKKHWKSLYYVAFGLTWLIYGIWYSEVMDWDENGSRLTGLLFAAIFFFIFYAVAISNRIVQKEFLRNEEIGLLLLNSFVFYGFGFGILDAKIPTSSYLGLFTLANALIHFLVGTLLKSRKILDQNLIYLTFGLVFTFITISIPIQLDGSWVTLLWTAQAVLLFAIGRTKGVLNFEKIAYVIAILAFFSLGHDWFNFRFYTARPIFNEIFLTSILVLVGYGSMVYLASKQKFFTTENQQGFPAFMKVFLPILGMVVAYFTFASEIILYFENILDRTAVTIEDSDDPLMNFKRKNYTLSSVKIVALIAYSLLFFAFISWVNTSKIKSKVFGILNLLGNLFIILIALSAGIYMLGDIRADYIFRANNDYFSIGIGYVLVRYLLFAALAILVYSLFLYQKLEFMGFNRGYKNFAELILYVCLLAFLSNELVTWLDVAGNKGIFKLGLSILWGVFSLFLIYMGIFKRKKHLRIGAIVLFGFTLLKLFFYDIANLNTLSKTIVFIILGALLLVISFLYNKFKDKISDDEPLV